MKVALLAVLGFILGAIGGGLLGIGAGMLWTEIAHTSNFEGQSGMLVFFGFMPVGALIGAFGGAIGLGMIGARRPAAPAG